MRILLTGARGMLGRRLHEVLSEAHEVSPTEIHAWPGIAALDITDEAAVSEVLERAPFDWIVNAAAYTAVDLAEQEQDAAFLVNARAPGLLARHAARRGARLLHVSTDFVFDGRKAAPYVESDPTGPLSAYGRSKEAGERAVLEADAGHAIVRLAWLFGPGGKNFVDTILGLARERGALRVVDDQLGTPTFTRDAAAAMRRIIDAGLSGIIHATNEGEVSWCGLARAAAELAGVQARIDPVPTSAYPTPAVRPANSRLDNAVLRATIGDPMRPWREALAAHLAEAAGEVHG